MTSVKYRPGNEMIMSDLLSRLANPSERSDVQLELRDDELSLELAARHKHWPAGPAHFSDRRTSSGQYILSFTGPYGPPRYMSGHQLSYSAGPNDDESQYNTFRAGACPTSRQLSRSPFATARRQRGASPSQACQSTH